MRFAGYAAVFDAPDRGGDIVRAGAFGAARRVPVLVGHRGAPVGVAEVREDGRGLRVIGQVRGVTVAAGAGLSFGYRVLAARQGTYRELMRLELIEVSLVAEPMQPLARVHAVAG